MTSREAAIRVEGLRVRRGGIVVLPDLSLEVDHGTVTGLLGPSGSGKTTLMRAIVGVQKVEAGKVTVLGRPAGDPELRRQVGYVTQTPSVYGDLTVRENLRYFARVVSAPARTRVEMPGRTRRPPRITRSSSTRTASAMARRLTGRS